MIRLSGKGPWWPIYSPRGAWTKRVGPAHSAVRCRSGAQNIHMDLEFNKTSRQWTLLKWALRNPTSPLHFSATLPRSCPVIECLDELHHPVSTCFAPDIQWYPSITVGLPLSTFHGIMEYFFWMLWVYLKPYNLQSFKYKFHPWSHCLCVALAEPSRSYARTVSTRQQ